MAAHSLKDQIVELKRELRVRGRVFPDWVRAGRISQAEADRRTGRMEAALSSLYELQALKSRTLFDTDQP